MAIVSEQQIHLFKENIPKRVGQIIRAIRINKNMTQTQLAQATNKDRQYIYKIEKGVVTPNIVTIAILAEALEVTLKEIFEQV